jgi:hypothetical protein
LYDPSPGGFTVTGPMTMPRGTHCNAAEYRKGFDYRGYT